MAAGDHRTKCGVAPPRRRRTAITIVAPITKHRANYLGKVQPWPFPLIRSVQIGRTRTVVAVQQISIIDSLKRNQASQVKSESEITWRNRTKTAFFDTAAQVLGCGFNHCNELPHRAARTVGIFENLSRICNELRSHTRRRVCSTVACCLHFIILCTCMHNQSQGSPTCTASQI